MVSWRNDYDKEWMKQCLCCKKMQRGKKRCEVNALLRRGREFWEDDVMYASLVRAYIKNKDCKEFESSERG